MPWVRIENDNTVIGQATGHTLTAGELDILCDPQGSLSDAILTYGVTVHNNPPITAATLWVEPSIVAAAKDGNSGMFDATLGSGGLLGPARHLDDASLTLLNDPTLDVILFPVNGRGRHFSLLAFYESTRSFVHYDSAGPANDAAAQALVDKLFAKGYLNVRPIIANHGSVVRQNHNYVCGDYVIEFARLISGIQAPPDDNQIAAVTNITTAALRREMLWHLQPLVAVALPAVHHPPIPSSGSDHQPTPNTEDSLLAEQEELLSAVERVQAQLAIEQPVEISGVENCLLVDPTTITVILTTADIEVQDIEGATVTFAIGSQRFNRRATESEPGTWTTGLTMKILDATVTVTVTGHVEPAAEFEQAEIAADEFEISTGEERTIELEFTPKEPRYFYARFLFEYQPEPPEIEIVIDDGQQEEEEDPVQRPFPEGYVVDLVLDEARTRRVAGTLDRQGNCTREAETVGIRVPHGCTHVWPQFPGTQDDQLLVWDDDPEDAPAVLVAADTEVQDDQTAGPLLPGGRWTPRPRHGEWRFPDEHFPDGRDDEDPDAGFHQLIDVSDGESIGSEDEPLVYVLVTAPAGRRMNGHPIDHVVVLMLENRGFDHFMGYLYEGHDRPLNNYPPNPQGPHVGLRDFEGMEGLAPRFPYDYDYTTREETDPETWADPEVAEYYRMDRNIHGEIGHRRGARACNIPRTNPHEDFVHIFQQMYGRGVIPDYHAMETAETRDPIVKNAGHYIVPTMTGFVHNFCDGARHHRGEDDTVLDHDLVSEIVDMYLPEQLPVMHGLARHYSVSDLWFCSVPSQTNTNRAFWASGAAAGLVTNDYYPTYPHSPMNLACDTLPAGGNDGLLHRRNLFSVLEENDIDWKYYWSTKWPPVVGNYYKNMFPQFAAPRYAANIPIIAEFYADAEEGTLPTVSYIEPAWGGGTRWDTSNPTARAVGNEFHPVQDMINGELFVKKVYKALSEGPKWDRTLFIITFDENGGTYDHFPPWEAVPPGREPEVTQFDFGFDCYGVRVPTLLISKYIKPGTIFRSNTATPLDHTSIIATILDWLKIPRDTWNLGARVDGAPLFDEVLDHAGDDDDERRANATGMLPFDTERPGRIGDALGYGDEFRLMYVGNKWAEPPPEVVDYLGGPVSSLGTWYPVATGADGALTFRLAGGEGAVTVGDSVQIEVAGGEAEGYSLAMPSSFGAGTVYLFKKSFFTRGSPSTWQMWLYNDRTDGTGIHIGDEVFIYSERYLPENLTLAYDPYQRLSLDQGDAPQRYARWRAGEWDIWRIVAAE